jgi:DNA polymerase-3 subunit alpha
VGAFEFALFGKNYIEFGKYMIKDLYLLIHAVIQEKGSDFICKPRSFVIISIAR